jgi:DNA-binding response OmpR family regulator
MMENRKLRDENEDLRVELIEARKGLQRGVYNLRRAFGLTSTEAAIAVAMAQGGVLTRSQIAESCCQAGSTSVTVDVHIHRIRKKIAPIQIGTFRGDGYYFESEHLRNIRAIINGDVG